MFSGGRRVQTLWRAGYVRQFFFFAQGRSRDQRIIISRRTTLPAYRLGVSSASPSDVLCVFLIFDPKLDFSVIRPQLLRRHRALSQVAYHGFVSCCGANGFKLRFHRVFLYRHFERILTLSCSNPQRGRNTFVEDPCRTIPFGPFFFLFARRRPSVVRSGSGFS